MNNNKNLVDVTINMLNESLHKLNTKKEASNVESNKDYLNRMKEENPEGYNVYTKLKELYPKNSLFLARNRIDVSIRVAGIELYGNINTRDKQAKLTIGSGPNPLTPEFLNMLNTVSKLLDGYEMLHY